MSNIESTNESIPARTPAQKAADGARLRFDGEVGQILGMLDDAIEADAYSIEELADAVAQVAYWRSLLDQIERRLKGAAFDKAVPSGDGKVYFETDDGTRWVAERKGKNRHVDDLELFIPQLKRRARDTAIALAGGELDRYTIDTAIDILLDIVPATASTGYRKKALEDIGLARYLVEEEGDGTIRPTKPKG